MAQQHLNTVLTEAGIDAKDIETILGLPAEDTTFNAGDYVGKINSGAETRLKNDPKFWEGLDENNVNEGFKKKIESKQYARATNLVRQKALRAFGFENSELDDLTEEEKKDFEPFLVKMTNKYVASKGQAPEIQKQLLEARKKLEDLEAEIPVRESKVKTELEGKYNNEKLDYLILAELSAIPDLKVPAQYLLAKLADELKEENSFVINGAKASPKQKANPTLDLLEGSKILTLKDLIVKKLTTDGLIGDKPDAQKQSGSHKADVTPDGTGKLAISPHIMEQIKKNSVPAA